MFTADQIADCVLQTFAPHVEGAFATFLAERRVNKWMIATDWCIRDPTRYNDAFAFTVFPYDAELTTIQTEITKALPKDIKKVKAVGADGASLLSSDRRFTFCFIPRRDRKLFDNLSIAQRSVDTTISMMEAWEDADQQCDIIREVKRLRQEMQAKSFNTDLLEDMALTAIFVAVIAALIAKHSKPKLIGWFPDRDKIAQGYRGIVNTLAAVNFSAFCNQRQIEHDKVKFIIGTPEGNNAANTLWYDPLVRIPDYIAGTIAAYDLEKNLVDGKNPKFMQMLQDVIADTQTIKVIRIVCSPSVLQASRIHISRTAPMS